MAQQRDDSKRDRVIADSGWGIKPDDQPANTADAGDRAMRSYHYDPSRADEVRQILLAQRRGYNMANRVRLEGRRMSIIDINGDALVVEGLGYGDPNLITLLESLGAAFDPQAVRQLTADDEVIREYKLSRAWAWGSERPAG